jgi:hypothetical protein
MSLRNRKPTSYPEHLAAEAPVMAPSMMEAIKEEASTTRTKWWLGGSLLFALLVGLTVGLIAVPVAKRGHCDAEVYDCPKCPLGKSLIGAKCEACPTGKYSNGIAPCMACTAPSTVSSNQAKCECPAGQVMAIGVCKDCTNGSYADVKGLETCKKCGTNAKSDDQKVCKCNDAKIWKAPTKDDGSDNGCAAV